MMDISAEIDKIKRSLMENGYKLTTQREIILRVLLEHEKEHLSAEDVYMLVKVQFPEIGLATVYRTLELLAELQVVAKMNFGDGVARFDLRGEDHGHMHHHLICQKCGALEEIKDDWLVDLEARLEKEYGFKVLDHRLDFMGTYGNCESGECPRGNKAV